MKGSACLVFVFLVVVLCACSDGEQFFPGPTSTPKGSTGEKSQSTTVPARQGEGGAAPAGANMFRGNPAHTGEYPGPGVEASPTLLWRFNARSDVQCSPTVVDGVAYTGSNEYLYALDAASGQVLWQHDACFPSPPAVVDRIVYYTEESCSGSDSVYALDAETGEMVWQFEMDGWGAPPVVVDGLVYVSASKSASEHVYSLNADTGEMIWRFDLGTSSHGEGSPAVADGVVYVASDVYVHALDASTGEGLWRSEMDSRLGGSLAVADRRVYLCGDDYVCALDTVSGEVSWLRDIDGYCSYPAVANGVVYVAADAFYALDSNSGEKLWQSEGYYSGTASVADGTLYVGSESERVQAIDAATGKERWRFETDGDPDPSCSPVVVNGVVYVGTEDGYVEAITGKR